MRSGRVWVSALALAAVLFTSSCWPFRKAKRPAPPPTPRPAPAQTTPAGAQPPPEQLPAPPQIPSKTSQTPPPVELPKEPPPPGPPHVRERRPSPAGPPVQAPAPAEPTPAPAPQLRQILTAQQRQELNREINDRLGRARHVVAALRKKSLNSSQNTALNQIRTFIEQAETARKEDLVRANNMAERADVLARDLWNSMR